MLKLTNAELNLTKLDVLDTFETIKVATAYKHPQTGEEIESFPSNLDLVGSVEVIYKELPGWNKPITAAKTYYDLPKACREYVEFIETYLGIKIKSIGVGPGRESMIFR